MNRIDVIQKIINKTHAKSYLEIGISRGDCFLSVQARRKVAVDPKFNLPAKLGLKVRLRNSHSEYFEMTSDRFFAETDVSGGFDVAFIDGMHTYEQSLKDVENVLKVLSPKGVIVMHDCNPQSAASAWPANSYAHAASLNLPGWNGGWMGDVWKTVCHLRSCHTDLRVFVLDCDFGLAVLTRGKPDEMLKLSAAELEKLDYSFLAANRQQLLNLKPESYFPEFLRTL
jgi:hypothetical protein